MSTKEKQYRELINEIKILIVNTASKGIDTSRYQKTLFKIIGETETDEIDASNENYVSVFMLKDYGMGITKLKQLEEEILETSVSLKQVPQEVNQCITDINDNVERISEYLKLYITNNEFVTCTKNIKKRLISIGLSLSMIVTGYFVLPKVVKSINTETCYHKNRKTYSMLDGFDEDNGYSPVSSKENDGTYIRVYGEVVKVGNQYEREVKIYDVTDIKLDNLNDYLKLNTDIMEYEKETINVRPNSSNYYVAEGSKEVEQITIDRTKKEPILDITMYGLGLLIAYLAYTALILMIEIIGGQVDYSYVGIVNNLVNILNKEEEIDEQDVMQLEQKLGELLNLINKDEELRNKFDKLLEENKYLLNNKKELMNRINKLESVISKKEVKKLVKSRNYRA